MISRRLALKSLLALTANGSIFQLRANAIVPQLPHVPVSARGNISQGGAISNPMSNGITFEIRSAQGISIINNTGTTLNYFRVVAPIWKPVNGESVTVLDWKMDTTGYGYTYATVTASPPKSGGFAATFQAIIDGGAITKFICRSRGAYHPGEVPRIAISGDGAGATAHVTMTEPGEPTWLYDRNIQVSAIEYPPTKLTPVTWNDKAENYTDGSTPNYLSDEIKIADGIPPGGIAKLRFAESAVATPPQFSITLSGGAVGAISKIEIVNSGEGMRQNLYAFTINANGADPKATANAYTYQGRVVHTEIISGGNYKSVPGIGGTALNWIFERTAVPVKPGTGDTNQAGKDAILSSANAASTFTAYVFPYLLARPSIAIPAVAVIGASQEAGFAGGDSAGDWMSNWGWASRRFGKAGVGTIKRAVPGDYASVFSTYNKKYLDLASYAPGLTAAVNCLGWNDILRGDPLATIQANILSIGWALRKIAPKVFQTTFLPGTTSSNGFMDVAGQKLRPNFGPDHTYGRMNSWLRDGMPIVGGAAVGTETIGAIRAGSAGHPYFGIFDISAQVEAPPLNSGYWQPMTAAGGLAIFGGSTGDGSHPRDAYHEMICGRLDFLQTSPGTNYTTAKVRISNLGFATATPLFSEGILVGFTDIDDGGHDYEFVPEVQFSPIGGVGSGCSAIAVLTNKRLTGFTKIVGGSGFANGAYLALSGQMSPIISSTIVSGGVQFILQFPGTGIVRVPEITITGDGAGATVRATIKVPADIALLS